MFAHKLAGLASRTWLQMPRFRFSSSCFLRPRQFSLAAIRLDQGEIRPASRNFSKVSDSSAAELYFEEIFELGLEGEDPLFDLRHYFYPESRDPHLSRLSKAVSVAEVLNTLTELRPTTQHLTQALATLHHLQKVCNTLGCTDEQLDFRSNVRHFNRHLAQSPKYQALLRLVNANIPSTPTTEAAFMLMVLRKLGEPLANPVMQQLYLHLLTNLSACDMDALSYMTVALRPRYLYSEDMDRANGHVWRLGLVPIIPRLRTFVEHCTTTDELKKIVICYNAVALLMTNNMMEILGKKVQHFIAEGMLKGPEHVSLLSKLLSLVLNKYDWHTEHGEYVTSILEQYLGMTNNLRPVQLILLSKVLRNFGQPVALFDELYHTLCGHMTRGTAQYIPSIVLLSHILQLNNLAMPLPEIEERLRAAIASPYLEDNMSDVYDILRSVGVVDRSIVEQYFDRCLDLLREEPAEVKRLAVRYSTLYNIYTGFYKNRAFEKSVTEVIRESLLTTKMPKDFADYLSVYLSFNSGVPQDIMERFHSMLPQLNPFSLMNISIGIENRLLGQNRVDILLPRDRQTESYQQLDEISVQVNKASLAILHDKSRDLATPELSFLFRNFTRRRSVSDEAFFYLLTERLNLNMEKGRMSSFIGHHLCLSLDAIRPLMELPTLVKTILDYFAASPELHFRKYHRILVFCFKSDHRPPQVLLDTIIKAMQRDLESMVGVRVLGGAVALCGFQALPETLAKAIFSAEFMTKLDHEMDMCRDGRGYIRQLREQLMLLNRCIVLQYPEYGVPWFHEKYCKEHEQELARRPATEGAATLRSEVYEELCSLVGGWRYVRENSLSKYYNHIDFELAFDQDDRPLDMHASSPLDAARRVAVLVPDRTEYTADTRRLLGKALMAARHLELQGWQVIHVNPFTWSAMCMSESAARRTYLQQTLQADAR